MSLTGAFELGVVGLGGRVHGGDGGGQAGGGGARGQGGEVRALHVDGGARGVGAAAALAVVELEEGRGRVRVAVAVAAVLADGAAVEAAVLPQRVVH